MAAARAMSRASRQRARSQHRPMSSHSSGSAPCTQSGTRRRCARASRFAATIHGRGTVQRTCCIEESQTYEVERKARETPAKKGR